MNISDGIERMRHHSPNKVAVVTGDGTSITYGELDASANRLALLLRNNHGVHPHDRVGILATNSIQFIEAFYGAIRAGCIAVPLSDQWSESELKACLDNCQPIVISVRSGSVLPLGLSIPVLELGGGPKIGDFLYDFDSRPLPDKPAKDDPFYIGYTSGSTGLPKGVLRIHSSWLDCYLSAAVEFCCSSEDRLFTPGALFYSLSLFAVTHALFLGSTVYIMPEFDPRLALDFIEGESVTTLCMVPTLYEELLRVRSKVERDLSSVKTLICAGSTWPRAEEGKREVLSLFPSAGLYEYYGASEMSFVSVSHPEDQMKRPHSVGQPFLGVRVEIRDEAGKTVQNGEVGVLYARSSYGFEGYYGDPERSATVLQGDWMTVGDLAYADEDGYLYIVGRKDNVVITGGRNVSVEEVEGVLNSHPMVQAAAVLGAADPRRGQILVALVQGREGVELSIRELRKYCSTRLASYKVPRKLLIVDAIPLTSSGKISRADLNRLNFESWTKKLYV